MMLNGTPLSCLRVQGMRDTARPRSVHASTDCRFQVVMTNIMKKFLIKDSGYNIQLGISSSLQSWAVGREEEGPWLPVRLELL